MEGQCTATAIARKRPRSENLVSARRTVVSLPQFQRVVARLSAGERERSIAVVEELPEIIVCRIRQLTLDTKNRQMAAVGAAVGTMLDTVRILHKEIETGAYEELLEEGAA